MEKVEGRNRRKAQVYIYRWAGGEGGGEVTRRREEEGTKYICTVYGSRYVW